LIEIFKAFHDWERALDFYRQELGLKTWENDEELIKYLEKLILEIWDENEAWKFHKLISLLHAKNWRFWDAIDHLNKTLIFETEENLWRVCVHLGIYFEKMWDHEFARSFLTTAKWMNKNRASYIGRILAICSRDIKRLEMEKAA
jgi:tetratricopeptide (TPR) repeat protein